MFSKLKRSAKSIIPIIVIAFCIFVMSLMFPNLREAGRTLESIDLYRGVFTFLTFSIGVFIEFDGLISAIRKGIKINPLGMVISIVILIILFIPVGVGMSITGFGTDAIIMQEGYFRGILGLISGVLFIRSI